MAVAEINEEQEIAPPEDTEARAMIEAGIHIGHTKNKRHPAMAPYIWTTRGGISIIDVVQTKKYLDDALAFLKDAAGKGGIILFVGTRPAARSIVAETARSLDAPYVTERWIGGTLTNFKVIAKRIETLKSLEADYAGGAFEKYTKKERLMLERKIARLKDDFDGLRVLSRLPSVVFVVNIPHDEIAVREARKIGIPVVALCNTNADPRPITYPIPSNDDARSALRYMLGRVGHAIEEGKNAALLKKEPEA